MSSDPVGLLRDETASIGSKSDTADRSKGIALVAIATIVWASGGLFTRLLPFDLWTIVFWRGVFATLFIGLFLIYSFGRSSIRLLAKTDRESLLVAACYC
jgi:low affinity Fe/Cu permease